MMWITEFGVWDHSENWHIYYVLRRIHGDQSSLMDKPVHVFRAGELEDFVSFVQIAMQNGWGGDHIG